MKIVHCFFTMRTGGAQLLAVDILNELVLFHEVSLIIINDQWDDALVQRLSDRVSVYFINRKEGSRNLLPAFRFNRLLHTIKPDIIHCHERKLIKLIHYRSTRTIYTIHDVNIPTDTFGMYNALAAISESVANDVRRRSVYRPTVINNGIRMTDFKQRLTYVIRDNEPIRFVQVSRLMHEKKGQDILLQAFAKLISTDLFPPITLDFIGGGESLSYLSEMANSLKINHLVRFLGERDRTWIAENLSDYHVLVQPSRYEGFGLTLLEGLAAGLPVVASNIEGPAEVLAGLAAGTLFTSESTDDCTSALAEVINAYRSAQIAIRMAETQPLIRERFSLKTMMTAYLNLYNQLLTPKATLSKNGSGKRSAEPVVYS